MADHNIPEELTSIDRAYKKLVEINERKQAIRDEIENARNCLKCLKEQRMLLEKTHDIAIRNYARAEILSIVTKIRLVLPREIRDMVYQHYWDEEFQHARKSKIPQFTDQSDILNFAIAFKPGPLPRYVSSSHPTEPWWNWGNSSYLTHPEYVGFDIAKEAALSFYQTTTLKLSVINIRNHLTKDIFSLGLTPRDCIRSVVLTISESYFLFEDCGGPVMINCFELLSTIQRKRGLDLQVRFPNPGWSVEYMLRDQLETFRPYYHSLTGAGANVTTKFRNLFSKKSVNAVEWLKVDVSVYYTADMDEWQRENWLRDVYRVLRTPAR